jgi:hypothetical protein
MDHGLPSKREIRRIGRAGMKPDSGVYVPFGEAAGIVLASGPTGFRSDTDMPPPADD